MKFHDAKLSVRSQRVGLTRFLSGHACPGTATVIFDAAPSLEALRLLRSRT